MSIKRKIIIISLLALSLIAFLLPTTKSNAAEGLNNEKDVEIIKGNDKMIESITNGSPNYVIKNDIINSINSTGYFRNNGSINNTYKIHMNNASSGAPIYTYDWLYCIEHGTTTFDGDYIIEKIAAITNREITTIRYATPAKLYNSSGLISSNDGSIKYLTPGAASGKNIKAKYNGKNVDYSIEVGKTDKKNVYYKLNETGNKNAARAYILSEKEDKNYSQYSNYSSNNKKQNALWNLEGQISTVNVGATNLYSEANRFAEYREKVDNGTVSKISAGSKAISVEFKSDYVLIGPFKATFNKEFGDINKIKIKYNTNQTLENGFYISNASGSTNGNINNIVNATDFYIKIPNTIISDKGITKINSITATFNDLNVYALYSFLIQDGSKDIQNQIIIHKAERKNKTTESEIETNKLIVPPIQIELEKVDTKGNIVNGPKFKVEYSNGLASETKTVTSGKITFTKRTPSNLNTFTATITETDASSGYKLLSAPIVLQFTYNSGKWDVIKISGPEENVILNTSVVSGTSGVKVKVENKSIIDKFTILKTDSQNSATKLQGAKFNIKLSNVESIKGYSTISHEGIIKITNVSGNIDLEDIVIKDLDENITIEIEETEAPVGYKKIDGKITVTLKRDGNSYTVHTSSKEDTVLDSEFAAGNVEISANHEITLNIKNIPGIQELVMNKTDSQHENPVKDAEFEVSFENVRSVNDANYAEGTKIESKTDKNGNFSPKIEKIIPQNANNPIIMHITETKAPIGYKKIEGTITLEVSRVDGKYKVTRIDADERILSREFNSDDLLNSELDNNYLYLNINNIPIMNIGGIVWEDAQTGNKQIEGPDGLYNNGESGMAGIRVFLIDGEPVVNSNGELVNTPFAETITSEDGKYLFEGIEVKDNYHVVFKYDGISYKAVEKGTQDNASKVDEINRNEFNAKFSTIKKDKAISTEGIATNLEYNKTDGKSELIHNDGNEIKQKYVMYSKSEKVDSSNWINTWTENREVNENDSRLNINCGLTYRFFDLALGTDVKEAKVSINDKDTIYSYADIMNGALNDTVLDNGTETNNAATIYNLYLYDSDFNYRISDYKTDGSGIPNKLNPDDIDGISAGNELEVEVTYEVILKNQSSYDATIDKFVYYYDDIYTPKNIESTSKYTVEIDETNRKITFTSIGNGLNVNENTEDETGLNHYRNVIDLTFTVNKDADGVMRKEKCSNVAEIIQYSTTEGGLVDSDSAPENAGIYINITGTPQIEPDQYEDDTDQAPGITISIKDDKIRTIIGTVWDDGSKKDADGILKDDAEDKVNDVIVQLIEVKNIGGKYYEYIWQETRSGSNEVKTTARNGYAGETYENGVIIGSGMYEFKGFIPGNYIIRFIYGDGTTYDITREEYKASADNVKKYNGQDYQSTNDQNYKKAWYNKEAYEERASVARDNEARRLEVMAYSTKINEEIGKALKDKTALNETWMCAETSRINVPVDADNLPIDERDNTNSENSENIIEFNNMNFGLVLRPQTKLTLEKHITSLKIVPNGVGSAPIVDAKANITDILNNNVNISGVTDGLATIVSDRDNRGFWKVETDIEELSQGAKLEVEYTYVIKNESDEDYLSRDLVNIYKNNISIDLDGDGILENNYSNELLSIGNTVKTTMRNGSYSYSGTEIGKYLGEFYYTGREGGNDTEVISRADGIEESLNEQFGAQTNVGDYFDVVTPDDTTLKAYINASGIIDTNEKDIKTVLKSKDGTDFSKTGDIDYSKTAKITTVLSSVTNGKIGGTYPSYIAEITSYSNAAGRRNMNGTPGDLSYVHSEDTDVTLNNSWKYINEAGDIIAITQNSNDSVVGATKVEELNGLDEFWGESIIISKPTGQDKLTGVQITIITISSIAILGVGIILIKKFVLKK